MLRSLSYIQKQSPRGVFQERCSTNHLDSLQENNRAKARLYSSTVFFCKYAAYAFFREDFWRLASIYCSKYRGYKYKGFLQAGEKLEIYFNLINTFSNFMRDVRFVTKG